MCVCVCLILAPALGLSYFSVGLACYLLEACPFLMRHRKEVDLDGRGGGKQLRGEERRETVIRLYCMRKEIMFSKRRNCSVVLFLIK